VHNHIYEDGAVTYQSYFFNSADKNPPQAGMAYMILDYYSLTNAI